MNIAPTADESEQLLAFLAHHREAVLNACHGLDETGARATPTGSVLSVGGLAKHLVAVEIQWQGWLTGTGPEVAAAADEDGMRAYLAGFHLTDEETLPATVAAYRAAAAVTDAAVAAETDLGREIELPPAPWLPAAVVTPRWVLLHLIEETARHAGHADIIRESYDGAQSAPLMAAVEGWPEDGWITPWKPAA